MKINHINKDPYRWVVAFAGACAVISVALPIPVFGGAIPILASSWHTTIPSVAAYGMDSYALGVLFAYFVSHSGIFRNRTKIAMSIIVAATSGSMCIIALMPPSLILLGVLRFTMGWGLASMGLQAQLLAHWFSSEERPVAIAFPLALGLFGLTLGGYVASLLSEIGLRYTFLITAFLSLIAFLFYFFLSRDNLSAVHSDVGRKPPTATKYIFFSDNHFMIWRSPYVWLLGLASNAQTWTLFTIGAFLPVFFLKEAKLDERTVGQIFLMFGFFILVTGFIGAFVINLILRRIRHKNNGAGKDNRPLKIRLWAILVGQVGMLAGLVWLAYLASHRATLGIDYSIALEIMALLAFLAITAIAFWTSPSELFGEGFSPSHPSVGISLFTLGMIANIGASVGPFLTSYLLAVGWTGTFMIGSGIQIVGMCCVFIFLILLKTEKQNNRLPFELDHLRTEYDHQVAS